MASSLVAFDANDRIGTTIAGLAALALLALSAGLASAEFASWIGDAATLGRQVGHAFGMSKPNASLLDTGLRFAGGLADALGAF
jgi:hypothetical protein